MTHQHATLLNDPTVRSALRQAWEDSQPGVTGGHEEGGFVLRDSEGKLSILRWPQGAQNSIDLPAHTHCRIDDSDIVATFHTHPNTSGDYLQEPSETDRRAVRDDPDLKGEFYVGELVISQATIYLITPAGHVSEVGESQALFAEG